MTKPLLLSKSDQQLIAKLNALEPKITSLLEVGCGQGDKLIYLQNEGNISVAGIDVHEPYIKDLQAQGIQAKIDNVNKPLPYPDKSFDWVLLGKVLHHLPRPQQAIKEAARVAQQGIIVTEPWFDKTIVSQQLSAELSAFFLKLEQGLGYFHRLGLTAGEVIALLDIDITQLDIEYQVALEELDLEAYFAERMPYIKQLTPHHYLTWELAQLKAKLKDHFLTQPGQLIMFIRF